MSKLNLKQFVQWHLMEVGKFQSNIEAIKIVVGEEKYLLQPGFGEVEFEQFMEKLNFCYEEVGASEVGEELEGVILYKCGAWSQIVESYCEEKIFAYYCRPVI